MIDTHAHLDFSDYKNDFTQVLQRASDKNIEAIICVGINEKSSHKVLQIAQKNPRIWATVGVHPHDAAKVSAGYIPDLEELAKNPRVVAIGETGLDYYRDISPREKQQQVFREQIRLARKIKKPLVIHCRDAYKDLIKILEEERATETGGILHCYSGDKDFAEKSLRMGFYISFSGTVTYKNAVSLREVVMTIPLERILVETDAPFLTPEPMRGKRNEPSFIEFTYKKVADLKNITVEELKINCRANLKKLTGINPDT